MDRDVSIKDLLDPIGIIIILSTHVEKVVSLSNQNAVVANFATTAADGKKYQVDYYNLDVIISVVNRVKFLRGTQFRICASNILKEYMKKGFA